MACEWGSGEGALHFAWPTHYYVARRLVHKANADLAYSRSYMTPDPTPAAPT